MAAVTASSGWSYTNDERATAEVLTNLLDVSAIDQHETRDVDDSRLAAGNDATAAREDDGWMVAVEGVGTSNNA